MGVKLSELVPKKEIEFEDLKNKKIAVDASNSLYQFLASIRQRDGTPLMDSKGRITSHLMGLFTRTANLITKGIKVCYVFDGKPPSLKIYQQEQREYRKRLAEEKFEQAKQEEDIETMAKYAKQTSRLTKDMISESKELVKALGLPVIQAPQEADAQAAFMCEKKDVWAVASSDYDSLLYGAPRMITNLTLSQRRKLPSGATIQIKPELVDLQDTLKKLKIKQDQLLALALLVGTDYNPGGVKRIGPKTALKLVKQYKDFDKLFKEVKAEFDWKQIYAIFKSMPVIKNYQLKWKEPDEKKILKILVDDHEFSEERVKKTLQQITNKPSGQKGLDVWSK